MHDPQFSELRRHLLRGGVAPKHVKRTIKELRHHFLDLEGKALDEGLPPEDAAAQAAEQLGDQELILEGVLARPELRSWAHRWAWAIYGLGPIILFILAIVMIFTLMIALVTAAEAIGLGSPSFAYDLAGRWWVRSLAEGWRLFMMYALPTVVAAGVCLFAARREARSLWPIIGVLLVAFLGFWLEFDIQFPEGPEELASFGGGVGFDLSDLLSVRVIRLLLPVIVTLAPYLWWRRLRQEDSLA